MMKPWYEDLAALICLEIKCPFKDMYSGHLTLLLVCGTAWVNLGRCGLLEKFVTQGKLSGFKSYMPIPVYSVSCLQLQVVSGTVPVMPTCCHASLLG